MNIKEKLSKVKLNKETFKGLARDFRNGCIVVKDAAADFYHSEPFVFIGSLVGASIGGALIAYAKGLVDGDELGRTEAAEEFGMGMAKYTKEIYKMQEAGELPKSEDE